MFDEVENAFFFVLNPTGGPADTYSSYSPADHPNVRRIELGQRTGYAFYRDTERDRRILVGVSYANIRSNNYFDGPFDQLPDRFVAPERMQALLERAYPDLKGKIGPRGIFLDSEYLRAMVAPYRRYNSLSEFDALSACDAVAGDNHALTRCLQNFSYR